MTQALAYLVSLIDTGIEFPDAVYKTSVKFKLSTAKVEELEQKFDEQAN